MNVSDFRDFYNKFIQFQADLIKISGKLVNCNLSLNQIGLFLWIINIIVTRLSEFRKFLELRRNELNAKKNEQTLF